MNLHTIKSLVDLPADIWVDIFTYLNFADLKEASLVSSNWRDFAMIAGLHRKSLLKITGDNLRSIGIYMRDTEDFRCNYCFKCYGLTIEKVNENCDISELQFVLTHIGPNVRYFKVFKSSIIGYLNKSLDEFMPNVESLHILSVIDNRDLHLNKFKKLKLFCINEASFFMDRNKFSAILQTLCDLDANIQLEELHLRIVQHEHENLLLSILQSQAQSLKKIVLGIAPLRDHRKWYRIWPQFKRLNTIETFCVVNAYTKFLRTLAAQLSDHLPLQHWDIESMEWDEVALERTLKKWPHQLKTLNCNHFYGIQPNHIQKIVSLQPNLQSLKLCGATEISEKSILVLAEGLPHLKELDLTLCCAGVTDVALARIFEHMTDLRILILSYCDISDKGLCGFGKQPFSIKRLRALRELLLGFCKRITNKTLIEALKSNELRTLDLRDNPNITLSGVETCLKNCPAIENLYLEMSENITDAQIGCINAPRLKKCFLTFQSPY